MKVLYEIGINLYFFIIRVLSWFGHAKAKDFIEGRKNVFNNIANFNITASNKKRIWVHVSSLGEYEQAKPVMEKLKKIQPNCQIFLSFFSPSGMNYAKTEGIVDFKFYLPKDSKRNAQKVIDLIHPDCFIFVKYDLWYHYILCASELKIPVLLISAHFRENQIYFKIWGGFYKRILQRLSHIYVQNDVSKNLLKSINVTDVTVCGDTRIDSVVLNLVDDKRVEFIEKFIDKNRQILILGSAWEDDWNKIHLLYNGLKHQYQLVIAPHDISDKTIQLLKELFAQFKTSTQSSNEIDGSLDVLIIDSIGWLKYLYKYSTVAWIGGGFRRSGIHNILEPAVHSNAILFGPNYSKFTEAVALISLGGAKCIDSLTDITEILLNKELIHKMAIINSDFVKINTGATEVIVQDIIENRWLYK